MVERTERSKTGDVEAEAGATRSSIVPASKANAVRVRLAPGLEISDATGQTLLAALVAWSATVAPAVLSRSSPKSAFLVAMLALVAGLAGPMMRSSRPNVARHVGITSFFVLVTLAWLLSSSAIEPLRLDPLRASIGAVAWAAFALSWREPWETEAPEVEARDPNASLLQARAALPRGAVTIMVLGIVAGVSFLIFAWSVRDADRALVAQALSVACAVAIISVAGATAVDRGKRSARSSRRMTPVAGRSLLLLFTFVAAGIAVVVLRR